MVAKAPVKPCLCDSGPAHLPRTRRAGANNTPRRWDDGAEPEGLSHERFHQRHPPPTNKVNGVDGLLFPKPTALNTVIACRQEGFVTEALEQALTCSFVQMGFMVEEGLQSNGLQEWPGSFPRVCEARIALWQCWQARLAWRQYSLITALPQSQTKAKRGVSEAGLDGFEAKGLGAAAMAEFYRIAGEPEAG